MTNRNLFSSLSIKMSLLMFAALLGTSALQARQIDVSKATSIAENFFSSKIKVNNGKAVKALAVDAPDGVTNLTAETAYYVFTPEDANGFVIVSAEDEAAPIVGYSLRSNYDQENIPAALAAYLSDYSKVVKAISDGLIQYKPLSNGGVAVEPLMKVHWNQSEPYDRLTPILGEGHAPTGCVATAMAQVMKYYEFPPKGNGSVSCSEGSLNLGHPYDWANMLDEYTGWDESSYNYTDVQANAVAVLMRDIGYSIGMSYGINASGAPSSAVAAVMCQHFNYSPDITYKERSGYSTQAWIDEIRASLLRKEPILYSGQSSEGGHEFVCDGIDADDMLHINWGWGGMSDGYFDVSILDPENLGIGGGSGAYYRSQDMVVNIRPGDPEADYLSVMAPLTLGNLIVVDYSEENGKLNAGTSLRFRSKIINTTGLDLNSSDFRLGLALRDSRQKLIGFYGIADIGSLLRNCYYYRFFQLPVWSIMDNGLMPDGKYSVSVVFLPYVNDNDYQLTEADILPVSSGDLNNVSLSVKEGVIYLDEPDQALNTQLVTVKFLSGSTVGEQYAGRDYIDLSFRMLNTGSILIENGKYDIHLVPIAEDNDAITAEFLTDSYPYLAGSINDIYLYPGVDQDVKCQLYAPGMEAGKYRLYATCYNNYDGKQKMIDIESPIYIELHELPKDNIVLTKEITNWWPELARNYYPYIGIKLNYCSFFANEFDSEFQIWCHKKGVVDSPEILIFKRVYTVSPGEHEITLGGAGEEAALWFEEIGTEMEAYIKFVDPDGKLRPIEGGNNHFEFTIGEDDSDLVINCVSPMVINHGQPVEAKEGASFDAEFEISVNANASFEPIYCRMYVTKDCKDLTHTVQSFILTDLKMDKTELSAGEKTKVNATFTYYKADNEPDLTGTTLHVMPKLFFSNSDGSIYGYRVQVMPYLESTAFSVVAPTIVAEEVVLSREILELEVGGSEKLEATVLPDNAVDKSVTWTSADESIASVDADGNVTALALGETVITASCGSVSATCKVTVVATPAESVTLDLSSWQGKVGDKVQLKATVLPESATDKTVAWASSDASVASVDSEGNVTAFALGETVITASCGSVSATCKVTVVATPAESVTLDLSSWQGKVGDKVQLKATVLPESATDKTVTWASADASVASVDAEGNVTALALGETVITASCGSVSATCKVTVIPTLVESISINPTEWTGNEGEKFTIVATVLPDDATDKTLDWSSSDTAIAEVDTDGNVTVLKAGTCKITVTTTDGSNLSAECIITSTSGIFAILIDANEPFDVYNMSGLRLRENTTTLDGLTPGIYIIRQGSAARKIAIK